MRPFRAIICLVALGAAGRASATAIVVCAASSGVVVSADSKVAAIDGRHVLPATNKILPVGNRTVVSVAGLAAWPQLHYEFHDWVRRIGAKLGDNPTPTLVAEAIRGAAESLFSGHGDAISSAGRATYFVVAGMDDDGLAVWEVGLFPDRRNIHALKQRKFGPAANEPLILSWGFPDSFGFGSKNGPLWQEVRREAPTWLLKVAPHMNLYQRASLCGLPIAVAAQRSSAYGLPIRQVLISPEIGLLTRDWRPPPQIATEMP